MSRTSAAEGNLSVDQAQQHFAAGELAARVPADFVTSARWRSAADEIAAQEALRESVRELGARIREGVISHPRQSTAMTSPTEVPLQVV